MIQFQYRHHGTVVIELSMLLANKIWLRFLKIRQNDMHGVVLKIFYFTSEGWRFANLKTFWTDVDQRFSTVWTVWLDNHPSTPRTAVPFWLGVSSHDDAFGLKYPVVWVDLQVTGGEGETLQEKPLKARLLGKILDKTFWEVWEVVEVVNCQLGMWNLKWSGLKFLIWSFCFPSACKAVVFHALIVLGEFFTSGFMWNLCSPLFNSGKTSRCPKTESTHKFCLHMIHLRRTQKYIEMHSPHFAPQKTDITPGKWRLFDCFFCLGQMFFFSGYVNLQRASLSRFQCPTIGGTKRRLMLKKKQQHVWILSETGCQSSLN